MRRQVVVAPDAVAQRAQGVGDRLRLLRGRARVGDEDVGHAVPRPRSPAANPSDADSERGKGNVAQTRRPHSGSNGPLPPEQPLAASASRHGGSGEFSTLSGSSQCSTTLGAPSALGDGVSGRTRKGP